MTRKRSPRIIAVPLSAAGDLRDVLAPFLGGSGTRDNVVMVRLSDDALKRMDQLIDAGLFGSRSEATAFLVGAGIQAQSELLDGIAARSAEIARLRNALRQTALQALKRGKKK